MQPPKKVIAPKSIKLKQKVAEAGEANAQKSTEFEI